MWPKNVLLPQFYILLMGINKIENSDYVLKTLCFTWHTVSFDNHRTLVSQMEIAGGAGCPVVGSHDIGKSKINVFCKGKVSLSNKVKMKVKIHFSPGDICIWNFNIFQKNSNFMVLKGNKLFFLKTGIIHDFFNNRPDFV